MSSEPSAPPPTVIVLADADDVGVSRVVAELRRSARVIWWRFGAAEQDVEVLVDGASFRLAQPQAILTSADFACARLVVYRRLLHQPRPPVTSQLTPASDRAFAEREWASLVEGLLLAEEQRSGALWLNAPSATALTHNKLALILRAARSGARVPSFTISSPVRLPADHGETLVTKAISTDERIDGDRYLTTARVSAGDVSGARVGTPCLLQELVAVECELRVFYALGDFVALALTPSAAHVDIRYATAADMDPTPYDLPTELRSSLGELAQALGLSYCAFDLLVTREGDVALVDITPNGSWAYFESAAQPWLSVALAGTMLRAITAA